eukprot:scaffold18357_cov73-Cylindrotheca_fusiformis.AAC.1
MAAESIPALSFATDQISKARTMVPQQSSVEEWKEIHEDRPRLLTRDGFLMPTNFIHNYYRRLLKAF